MLAKIDLETTAVFVLSDHGFKSGERRIRSEELVDVRKAHLDHEPDGIFVAAGPDICAAAPRSRAPRCSTSRRRCSTTSGSPVAKDMDGKVLEGALRAGVRRAPSDPLRLDATRPASRARRSWRPAADRRGRAGRDRGRPARRSATSGERRMRRERRARRGRRRVLARDPQQPRAHPPARRASRRRRWPSSSRRSSSIRRTPRRCSTSRPSTRARARASCAEHFVQRALAVDPELDRRAGPARRDPPRPGPARRGDPPVRARRSRSTTRSRSCTWARATCCSAPGATTRPCRPSSHVLELEPDSFKARYNLGVTYSNMGRIEEALAIYEEALELDPKDFEAPAARNNLGALLLAQGETERALAHFEAALEAAPGNLESRFNAALDLPRPGPRRRGHRAARGGRRARAQPRASQPAARAGLPGRGPRPGSLQVAAPRPPPLPGQLERHAGPRRAARARRRARDGQGAPRRGPRAGRRRGARRRRRIPDPRGPARRVTSGGVWSRLGAARCPRGTPSRWLP